MTQPFIMEPLAANPGWYPTPPRQGFGGGPPVRMFASLVLLPDGSVVMVGGTQNQQNDQFAVLEAEQYDPIGNSWTKLAAATVPRQYHSTALLLPDGRVWTGGSNPNDGTVREERMEVFSPPYLSGGLRPAITSSPETVALGGTFSVGTDAVNDVSQVALLRCGSSTHGFDADQRHIELQIHSRSVSSKSVVVFAPPNSNVAPPGMYMLFILNALGVPSPARMVRI